MPDRVAKALGLPQERNTVTERLDAGGFFGSTMPEWKSIVASPEPLRLSDTTKFLHMRPVPLFAPMAPDRIRDAQTALARRGYLNARTDIDGQMGPKTRRALARFQAQEGIPRTSPLDTATAKALGIAAPAVTDIDWARYSRLVETLVLEPVTKTGEYRLSDRVRGVLFEGDSTRALAEVLNDESLGRRDLTVALKGFSEDKAEALGTSLRIQQFQLYPHVSAVVLGRHARWRENVYTPGIRLDDAPPSVEMLDDTGRLMRGGLLRFSVHIGAEVRSVPVRLLAATVELYNDLCDFFRALLPGDGFDETRSLYKLVEDGMKRMGTKYQKVPPEDLRLDVIKQLGTSEIGLRFCEPGRPWS